MHLHKLLKSITAIFFCCVSTCLCAQGTQANKPYNDVTIASPTAASLGKYADIPVNYYTGVPDISIPIYTVKEGTLSLPVSLSYHASGLKVMETASWVGAGWSLNAGGVITRSVMGGPDEKGTNNAGTETGGYFSDYGYSSYLYPNLQSKQEDWDGFANGVKDGEPDLFFFNFNGYSGKFYFNDDRTPILVPESDLKITCAYTGGNSTSIASFQITTPDGVKYSFGRTAAPPDTDPVEMTLSVTASGGASSARVISSWYLNRIESADGQYSIDLSYTVENYGYYTIATFAVDPGSPSGGVYGSGNTTAYGLVKNIIQGVRLNQITFADNDTLYFDGGVARTDLMDDYTAITNTDAGHINTASLPLKKIRITDGSFCKQFNFYYSYFTDNTTTLKGDFSGMNLTSDRSRLRLDSLAESSCDALIQVPPYVFTYNATQPPRRLSFATDHLGNYNGRTNNTGLIPDYYVDGTKHPGADREPQESYIQAGILKQIAYPTGGTTQFVYGGNKQTFHSSNSGYQQLCTPLEAHNANHGVSATDNTTPFTVSQSGYVRFTIKNFSPQTSVSFEVKTAGGTLVYNPVTVGTGTASSPATKVDSTQLAPGNYTAHLFYQQPQYLSTPEGAEADMDQYTTTEVLETKSIGGLRIDTIKTTDGTSGLTMITAYDYTDINGQSTGVLFSRPTYAQNIRNDLIRDVGYWNPSSGFQPNPLNTNGCPVSGLYYYISAGTLRPMNTIQGYHMGYSSVKVSQSGNGYSVYEYVNPVYGPEFNANLSYNSVSSGCSASTPNYPAAPPAFDFTRGDLKREGHYSESSTLLKETNYQNFYTSGAIATPCFIVQYRGSNQTLGTRYNLVSARKTRSIITEYIYPNGYPNPGTKTVKTVYYSTTAHHEDTSTVIQNSSGDVLETRSKYAFEFIPTAVKGVSDGIAQFNTSAANCQSKYNTDRLGCGGASLCLTDKYINFLYCQDTARITFINTRRTNFTDIGNVYQSTHNTAKTAANTVLKPVLELQDEYKNPVIETSQYKNGNLVNASYNCFDYGLSGSAFVYPDTLKMLYPSAFASTFAASLITSDSKGIMRDTRYDNEAYSLFKNGNPVQLTQKDGIPQAFVWDYQNTVPVAKVANATQSDIAYTSFETSSNGNWTISGGTINTTNFLTGSRSYTVGTSISKTALNTAKSYIVSYWSKGYPLTVNSTAAVTGLVKNGWTYCQHTVPAGVSTITLTGSGTIIDELRLYPVDAQMTTYTYRSLLGITSMCAPNNLLSYYEYDALGRLARIRDIDRNILKQYSYKYQGRASSLDVPFCASVSAGYTNKKTVGYTVSMTNTANGNVVSFAITAAPNATTPATGTQNNIPPGIYNITINQSGGAAQTVNFQVGSVYQTGTGFASSNMQIACPSTLNITIQ